MKSDELLLLSLNVTEMRVLLAMRHLSDSKGVVAATMEELGVLTNYGRESVRLAVRGLEKAGIISTSRTKRNLGRLYKNQYLLLPENLASESEESKILPDELPEKLASTAGTSSIKLTSNTLVKNTSYSLAGEARLKEVTVVNRWKDDDDLGGGFGLLDSDIQKKQAPKKVSKARPVNRIMRPEAEWSAQDVATEFSMMLYQHCKAHTGPIDSNKLRAVLSGYRSRYKLTATAELEVMRRMFRDKQALMSISRSPENGYKVFLNWLVAHHNQTANGTIEPQVDKVEYVDYIYASDGTEFDNSFSGKIELAEHEASLKK